MYRAMHGPLHIATDIPVLDMDWTTMSSLLATYYEAQIYAFQLLDGPKVGQDAQQIANLASE